MKKLSPKRLVKDSLINTLQFKLENSRYIDLIAILLCGLFILAGILVSLHRYWQYEVFYYDFGIFDQAIWNVSRFKPPIIEHLVIGGKWIFADHFSPGIFLFSPLYWLTDKSEILLIAQAVIVGLSGFVLYRIGKEILKNSFYSLSIIICYFLFLGLQNAVISDFHELTVMTLPLALTFWALIKRKMKLYFIFLLVTFSFKETTFLIGLGISAFLIFFDRKLYKIAIITFILSILCVGLSIKFIIPYFSGGEYSYSPTLPEGFFGKIYAFIDHPLKRDTLFYSFWSFGFLSFLTPGFWTLLLLDFGSRFLSKFCCSRWDLGLHYNTSNAIVLALSSFFAIHYLLSTRFKKYVFILCIFLIINAVFLYRFKLHGPFALAYNPTFYSHTKNFTFLDEFIKKIPRNASVMTQNNLAVRFTHQKVWLLRKNYMEYNPDYILIDNREGQNANNFFPASNITKMIKEIKSDSHYSLIFQTDQQFLFKKSK